MDNCYRLLEVEESADLKEVKKAYLNKVRKFTPEENPKEFIKIRKAYEEILNNSKYENKIKNKFLGITKLIMEEEKKEELYDYTNLIKKEATLQNFKYISDNLIDTISFCNKNNRGDVAIILIDEFVEVFEELNLNNLKESYLLLRDSIKERSSIL